MPLAAPWAPQGSDQSGFDELHLFTEICSMLGGMEADMMAANPTGFKSELQQLTKQFGESHSVEQLQAVRGRGVMGGGMSQPPMFENLYLSKNWNDVSWSDCRNQ